MGKKLVNKKNNYGEVVQFVNPGDSTSGQVLGVHETETQNGLCDVLDLVDDDGAAKSVFLSANLKSYDWTELVGKKIEITFKQFQRNEKTKRNFKVFEVYELD
jgi:hypothetical protein